MTKTISVLAMLLLSATAVVAQGSGGGGGGGGGGGAGGGAASSGSSSGGSASSGSSTSGSTTASPGTAGSVNQSGANNVGSAIPGISSPSATDNTTTGRAPGVNPANSQDTSRRSNPSDRTLPAARNPQDMKPFENGSSGPNQRSGPSPGASNQPATERSTDGRAAGVNQANTQDASRGRDPSGCTLPAARNPPNMKPSTDCTPQIMAPERPAR
jgi:hypothetical protein